MGSEDRQGETWLIPFWLYKVWQEKYDSLYILGLTHYIPLWLYKVGKGGLTHCIYLCLYKVGKGSVTVYPHGFIR